MRLDVRMGLHYSVSAVALPVGIGAIFGAAWGVVALGFFALGLLLLDTYLLHRRPEVTRE